MGNWKTDKKAMEDRIAQLEAEAKAAKVEIPVVTQAHTPDATPVVDPMIRELDAIVARGKQATLGVTKPWEKKDTHKPWRMDTLKLSKLRPGFHARWVRRDNVEKRMLQGYVVADKKDYTQFENPIAHGTNVASYVTRGDLVLMEIPVEGKIAREQAMESRIKKAEKDAKERVKEAARELAREMGVEEIQVTEEQ